MASSAVRSSGMSSGLAFAHEGVLRALMSHLHDLEGVLSRHCDGQELSCEKLSSLERDVKAFGNHPGHEDSHVSPRTYSFNDMQRVRTCGGAAGFTVARDGATEHSMQDTSLKRSSSRSLPTLPSPSPQLHEARGCKDVMMPGPEETPTAPLAWCYGVASQIDSCDSDTISRSHVRQMSESAFEPCSSVERQVTLHRPNEKKLFRAQFKRFCDMGDGLTPKMLVQLSSRPEFAKHVSPFSEMRAAQLLHAIRWETAYPQRAQSECSIDVEHFVHFIQLDTCDLHTDVPSSPWVKSMQSAAVNFWNLAQAEARHQHLLREEAIVKNVELEKAGAAEAKVPSSQVKDIVVAFVILLNAFLIGLQLDLEETEGDTHGGLNGWDFLEWFFIVFFVLEMLDKQYSGGCGFYFNGPDCDWNIFDFCVVMLAISEQCINFVVLKLVGGSGVDMGTATSLIKMARLGRLARLVRLLRFSIFKELKAMVIGVFSGLRVLLWAIVLFGFFLYVLGLIARYLIGSQKDKYSQSFGDVPQAMFTIFRCCTDGCSADDGTPLPVKLVQLYGAKFMIPYMLVFLFVTIGLFNLIMAIFVDNVTESNRKRNQAIRRGDRDDLGFRLRSLIRELSLQKDAEGNFYRRRDPNIQPRSRACRCFAWLRDLFTGQTNKARLHQLSDSEPIVITRNVFYAWLEDEQWREMIDDLDISVANPYDLFDVLDADMSGALEVDELVDGLMRLRGPAEKSDAVAALLCVRVVQQSLSALREEVITRLNGPTASTTPKQAMVRFDNGNALTPRPRALPS